MTCVHMRLISPTYIPSDPTPNICDSSLYLINTCEPCLETKHRFHGQALSHSLDLRKYDGIVCVSGDGVLVEVSETSEPRLQMQLQGN
jgi:hypothetical protein